MIVIIHEIGHVIFAKIFKRKITKIELLPFGGMTKMDAHISENIYEDILISVGGIFMQCLFGFYLRFLNSHCTINQQTFAFLENYNITIIIFNLIPISPLDGYKMLKYFTELVVPFKQSFRVMRVISISLLGILSMLKFEFVRNNIFIFVFLIITFVEEVKMEKYILNRFYLERINYDFNFKEKNVSNYKKMFKNKINYIKGIHEKVFLTNLFSRKMH